MTTQNNSDPNDPIWLRDEVIQAAKDERVQAYAKDRLSERLSGSANSSSSSSAVMDSTGMLVEGMEFEDYQLMREKYHSALQFAYIICSVLMITSAVLEINNTDTETGFIAIYVMFFAIIIFCFEIGPCFGISYCARSFKNNCGFLYSSIGRSLFLIFVCAWLYHLALFGKIVMGLLSGATAFNWYIIWKYPKFPEYLKLSHEQLSKKNQSDKV